MSSLQVASAAVVFVHHLCPEEESDEKDVGGKRSCTERGLCIVVPFFSRFEVPRIDWSSFEWHQQIWNY